MRFSIFLLPLACACTNGPGKLHPTSSQHSTAEMIGVPGRCEDPAPEAGTLEGCYWDASVNLGRQRSPLYWQIDRYPDAAAAEANKTPESMVRTIGGRVLLQSISSSAEWSSRGEHLATIGPLPVRTDVDLTARFMEATSTIDEATLPHVHSGPEGFFQLDGSVCIDTSAGVHRVTPGNGVVWPAGVFMQLHASSAGLRRSLVLVVHPASEPWINRQISWKAGGHC
jgi:hypothetical protein